MLVTVVIFPVVLLVGLRANGCDGETELRLPQAIDEALENNPEIHVFRNKHRVSARSSLTVPFSVVRAVCRHADDLMED